MKKKDYKFMYILLLIILISCKKTVNNNLNKPFAEDIKNSTHLNVYGLDTLSFNKINYVDYQYFNKNYEKYEINKDRFVKIYYVVDNDIFKDEIEDISNYNYESVENIQIEDSLYLSTFGLYGDKIYTFIILDLVQIPKGDSIQLKHIEERYIFKTHIKR